MLTMMAELASLEKELIAERRTAGIKCAQLERKHCGRPIKATAEQVRKLRETFALLRMCDEMNVRGSLPPPSFVQPSAGFCRLDKHINGEIWNIHGFRLFERVP